MADTKLIFGPSVEALLKAARGSVSVETEGKLRALGLPLDGRVEPAYPAEAWASAVKLISKELFPAQPEEEQHRQLGRKTVKQFADTVMGKAMFTMAKVIGPQRSLQRMTNNLRTGANFIETRFTVIDVRTQELWISDVSDVPGFYAGLIEAGADYMEGWSDEMRITRREGKSCLFTLRRTY
ncbi:MAG: DUF2378 family protein [Myxococcaceae bacterium]